MPDLGEVLGTLLASLAHARRIADEETAAIAEYYRQHPLLEGLSLPRIRVPELTIELPVLVEGSDAGRPGTLSTPGAIKEALGQRLIAAAAAEGVELPRATRNRFEQQLAEALREAGVDEAEAPGRGPEEVARAVEKAFGRTLAAEPVARLEGRVAASVSRELLREAAAVAMKTPPVPPSFHVAVTTSEVKEKADPGTVVNLRIVLREEGLEWTAITEEDGTVRRSLTPE